MHSFTTHTKYTHIYLYIALQETSNSFFVNRQQQNIAIIRSDDNDDIIIFVLDLHRLIHGLHLLSLNTEDQKYWVGKHSNHISYKGTQFHPKAYTYKWDKIYHSIHLHTSGIFVWSGEEEDKNLGLEWMLYKIIPMKIKMNGFVIWIVIRLLLQSQLWYWNRIYCLSNIWIYKSPAWLFVSIVSPWDLDIWALAVPDLSSYSIVVWTQCYIKCNAM